MFKALRRKKSPPDLLLPEVSLPAPNGVDKGRADRTSFLANTWPGSLDMNGERCSHNTVTKRDLLENFFPRGVMSSVPWNAPEQF